MKLKKKESFSKENTLVRVFLQMELQHQFQHIANISLNLLPVNVLPNQLYFYVAEIYSIQGK